jgi:hypothetical protein
MLRRVLLLLIAIALACLVLVSVHNSNASTLVVCNGNVTNTLQAALNRGGSVSLSAGTCSVTQVKMKTANTTLSGAGATTTTLSELYIMGIKGGYDILANLTLKVGSGPEAAIWSSVSHTTIEHVAVIANGGSKQYGVRLIGPNPCASYPTHDTVVNDVTITSQGTGGFASLDLSCTNGIDVTGLRIQHGGIVAVYRDEHVVIDTMSFQGDSRPCQHAIEITGSANDISISNLTSVNGGILIEPNTGVSNVSENNVQSAC